MGIRGGFEGYRLQALASHTLSPDGGHRNPTPHTHTPTPWFLWEQYALNLRPGLMVLPCAWWLTDTAFQQCEQRESAEIMWKPQKSCSYWKWKRSPLPSGYLPNSPEQAEFSVLLPDHRAFFSSSGIWCWGESLTLWDIYVSLFVWIAILKE